MEAVRPSSQKTSPQEILLPQAEAFWIQWVEAAFPDLDSRAYFLPPVYFNRVPMNQVSVAGERALVLQKPPKSISKPVSCDTTTPSNQTCLNSTQPLTVAVAAAQMSTLQLSLVLESDVRDDTAMQRVLFCLQKLSEKTKEVFVGISQLQFGQYLGEPCYSAAAAHLPQPANLSPDLPRKLRVSRL
ncbi:uncharacterized protein LOC112575702 [Pomacea canaliculata]|uniref:uncharacterized protein LOC112575702 n=1 Tax=Pomacea canaliculata TaxID=400727 RepID=UPI000D72E6A5|nr:uncharacterized protein LOC112575702 [Pomacea canaliculata]